MTSDGDVRDQTGVEEWHRVAGPDELGDGERKIVTIGSIEIGVFRMNARYLGWRNVCPHAGAPVCLGLIEGTVEPSPVYEYRLNSDRPVLRCPWHGWEFDLSTGTHLTDESIRLKGYRIVADDDGVHVVLRRRVPRKEAINGEAIEEGEPS